MTDDTVVQERVRELTWSLVDEQITEDEFALLDNLLLSDDKARRTYLECMQLHADLTCHFAAPETKSAEKASGKSPILSFLNTGDLPLDLPSPSAGDATP